MKLRKEVPNPLVDKSLELASGILEYVNVIKGKNHDFLLDQLLRSGTAVGANIREAQNSESRKDFIHKMKIAAKEADETKYWLLLSMRSYEENAQNRLLEVTNEIIRILAKSIKTAIENKNNEKRSHF